MGSLKQRNVDSRAELDSDADRLVNNCSRVLRFLSVVLFCLACFVLLDRLLLCSKAGLKLGFSCFNPKCGDGRCVLLCPPFLSCLYKVAKLLVLGRGVGREE